MDDIYVSYVLEHGAASTGYMKKISFLSISEIEEMFWGGADCSESWLLTDKKTRLLRLEKAEKCGWANGEMQHVFKAYVDRLIGKRVRCSWGDPVVFEGRLDCTLVGSKIIEGAPEVWTTTFNHWCRVILDDGCAVIVNTSRLNSIEAI